MTDGGRKPTIASLSDKLEKLTETITLFQRNTADKLSILVNEIQEVRKSQEFLNEKYKNEMSSIKQTNKELQTENKYLKETLLGLESQNEALELSVNELEQYSRRPCLEFQGIPYTKDESTDELIIELAQKIGVNICNSESIFLTGLLNQPTLIQIQVLLPNFILDRWGMLSLVIEKSLDPSNSKMEKVDQNTS